MVCNQSIVDPSTKPTFKFEERFISKQVVSEAFIVRTKARKKKKMHFQLQRLSKACLQKHFWYSGQKRGELRIRLGGACIYNLQLDSEILLQVDFRRHGSGTVRKQKNSSKSLATSPRVLWRRHFPRLVLKIIDPTHVFYVRVSKV